MIRCCALDYMFSKVFWTSGSGLMLGLENVLRRKVECEFDAKIAGVWVIDFVGRDVGWWRGDFVDWVAEVGSGRLRG